MADGVALGKRTVKIKVRSGALQVIAIENSSAPANSKKSDPKVLSEPVSPPVGKNHSEENVILLR